MHYFCFLLFPPALIFLASLISKYPTIYVWILKSIFSSFAYHLHKRKKMSAFHQFRKNPWVVFIYLFHQKNTDSYAYSFPPFFCIYPSISVSLYKSKKLEYLLLVKRSWVLPSPFYTPKALSLCLKGSCLWQSDSQVKGGDNALAFSEEGLLPLGILIQPLVETLSLRSICTSLTLQDPRFWNLPKPPIYIEIKPSILTQFLGYCILSTSWPQV